MRGSQRKGGAHYLHGKAPPGCATRGKGRSLVEQYQRALLLPTFHHSKLHETLDLFLSGGAPDFVSTIDQVGQPSAVRDRRGESSHFPEDCTARNCSILVYSKNRTFLSVWEKHSGVALERVRSRHLFPLQPFGYAAPRPT